MSKSEKYYKWNAKKMIFLIIGVLVILFTAGFGGIISYFLLRKKHEKFAKGLLYAGILYLIISIISFVVLIDLNKSDSINNQNNILQKMKNSVAYVRYDFTGKDKDGIYFEKEVSGSGVILTYSDSKVLIYTNRHVVDCAYTDNCYQRIGEKIRVRTQDGQMHDVQRVAIAPHNLDLAYLEITNDNSQEYSTPLIRGEDLLIGEKVTAIGYPTLQGVNNVLEFSVTQGKVTNIQELLTNDGFSFKAIQSDAYANFGSSGGGLFDNDGNFIGITTWKTGTQENMALSAHSLNLLNNISLSTSDDSQKWTFCKNNSYVISYNDHNYCADYCNRTEVLGEDRKCHSVCEGFYCKSDKIQGDDSRCNSGYIFGSDGYCHPPCGSTLTYCPSLESICFENNCVNNCRSSGKYLFDDGTCRFYK